MPTRRVRVTVPGRGAVRCTVAGLPAADPDEPARLDGYQATLLDALHTKQDLGSSQVSPNCGP